MKKFILAFIAGFFAAAAHAATVSYTGPGTSFGSNTAVTTRTDPIAPSFTIADATLSVDISFAEAGNLALRLSHELTSTTSSMITLFDFPNNYTAQIPPTNAQEWSFFDTTLAGTYIFRDDAATDFEQAVIAHNGGTLPAGTYRPSRGSLSNFIGESNARRWALTIENHQAGTGSMGPWSVTLSPVPLPAAIYLFGAGLALLVGVARRIRIGKNLPL